MGQEFPDRLAAEIRTGYAKLRQQYGEEVSLAVRSSATAEDLPTASFAGQQETFLNVRGEESLLDACRRCFASLFTDRAIHYRIDQSFDHLKVALSIGVMKMVRSDLAASGVMFTLDTESGFRDVVFITGAYGLGENVVPGAVDPDEIYVHKPTFARGRRAVLRRRLGDKAVKMVFVEGETKQTTRNIPTPKDDRARFCLTDEDALELTQCALAIEAHYGRPMDIEWAKDGVDGKIYIVQARPETVASQRRATALESYVLNGHGDVLVEGRSVGEKIAAGKARLITSVTQLSEFKPGEILVADTTTPDWEPVMKTAAAIVTNRGGRTCHAAIIARELGVPAVVGVGDATLRIPNGANVTVSCTEGDTGRVYRGQIAFSRNPNRGRRAATAHHRNHGQSRESGPRFQDLVPAQRWRRPSTDGVHHQRGHQSPPTGVGAPRAGDGSKGAGNHRPPSHRIRKWQDVLRPASLRGNRDDRGGLLAEAGRGANVRLQNQRVRQPPRGNGLRAPRREPDAGVPRRLPLRAPRLRRRIRSRMPGHETGAGDDGPDKRDPHAPLRPPGRGGGARPGANGDSASSAARTASRSTRCARSPTTSS